VAGFKIKLKYLHGLRVAECGRVGRCVQSARRCVQW
jgi:hypothetical protein